jgi:hypothetical protein
VTEPNASGPCAATIGLRDAPPHAGQVVRRVLLRRNIVIDAETAQLIAAAVQAALRAGTPSRLPRRRPRVPPSDCEPLFEPEPGGELIEGEPVAQLGKRKGS